MTIPVAIIGAGALGSRHLQALARVGAPLAVTVIDPSEAARETAASRLAEAGGLEHGSVIFSEGVASLSTAPQAAIVATNSKERRAVIMALLEKGTKTFILEKVLFARLSDYDAIDCAFAAQGARAWVNVPRRSYPGADPLRRKLGSRPFAYSVTGTGWGLACNVIHHLDEFEWLSGSPVREVNISALVPGYVPSKRSGYIELMGTLRAKTERGDTFEAACSPGTPGDRIVRIVSGDTSFSISQLRQTMTIDASGSTTEETYPVPMQSVATAEHVNALLEGRAPSLPTWDEASRLHCKMISAFLDHLGNTSSHSDKDECPIT